MAKNIKKRNWAFVLYEDSAPEDWREKLQLSGLCCAISPYHDKDINPDGSPKKPHYHIILSYGNTTTYSSVLAFTKNFNATIPQPLESVRGYYRYLTHKDNPEKYQYNENDIILLNEFDISEILNSSEVFHILKLIEEMIDTLNFTEYADLMKYLRVNELNDYYNVACSHTLFLNTIISSYRNKAIASAKKEQNKRTTIRKNEECVSSDNVYYVNFYKLENKMSIFPIKQTIILLGD